MHWCIPDVQVRGGVHVIDIKKKLYHILCALLSISVILPNAACPTRAVLLA